MLSKSQIKLINSLGQKKYRQRHKLFLAEGRKTISELLGSRFVLHSLYTTQETFGVEDEKLVMLDEKELKKISQLSTPQRALAVFHMQAAQDSVGQGLKLALDGLRDPGNMGTIIRLCDWFGITDVICSPDSVDCFNPKVVQASMGSIARINLCYTSLTDFLEKEKGRGPVYGTFMDGENIYTKSLAPSAADHAHGGIIVMGNEANGISGDIEVLIDQKIAIPQFGAVRETESLNVATATAIILSEFRRQAFIER